MHGLTFSWTGAYTDAKLTSDAPAVNGNSGDPLPYAPKWSTSLDGEYDWVCVRRLQGVRRRHLELCRLAKHRLREFARRGGQVELPSYNTFDARIGFDNEHYRVTLYGKNLGDTRGITSYTAAVHRARRARSRSFSRARSV